MLQAKKEIGNISSLGKYLALTRTGLLSKKSSTAFYQLPKKLTAQIPGSFAVQYKIMMMMVMFLRKHITSTVSFNLLSNHKE